MQIDQQAALIYLARIIKGAPFIKSENSQSGAYDEYLVVIQFIRTTSAVATPRRFRCKQVHDDALKLYADNI